MRGYAKRHQWKQIVAVRRECPEIRDRRQETPGGTSPHYTAQERERMQTGLRILARFIARAHLRRQSSGATSAPPEQKVGD